MRVRRIWREGNSSRERRIPTTTRQLSFSSALNDDTRLTFVILVIVKNTQVLGVSREIAAEAWK